MRKVKTLVRERLWERDLRALTWYRRLPLGAARAVVHVAGNFEGHAVPARAGALTMTTLLAVVPLAALVFSIAKGFGFGEELDAALVRFGHDAPPQITDAIDRLRLLVAGIDFRRLGILSTLIVLYTGMSLFVRIERAINHAWLVTHRRSWMRRFSEFLALVCLVPPLAIGAYALQSATWVQEFRGSVPGLRWLNDVGLGLLPAMMLSGAATALYKFMPNTRVEWPAAAVGGVVVGISLMFMHGAWVHFQFGVARSNAIYATLAALPLLIVYLQAAWTIVLAGAELSHAVQYASLLGAGRQVRDPTPALRERLALALTERAVQGFARGDGGVGLGRLATDLDMPRSIVESVCRELADAGIIANAERDRVLPARPGAMISVEDVRRAIRGAVPGDVQDRLALSAELESTIADVEREERAALGAARFATS